MKRIRPVFLIEISFLFSLAVSTNLFALVLHHVDILGRPQLGKWYEPFHVVYWFFSAKVVGDLYRSPSLFFSWEGPDSDSPPANYFDSQDPDDFSGR